MGAIAYIKEHVKGIHHKSDKQGQKPSFSPGSTQTCHGEFIDEDFDSTEESSLNPIPPDENAPHWRPGSTDDIPYE